MMRVMDVDDEEHRTALRVRERIVVAIDQALRDRVEVVTIAGDADDVADARRRLMEVFGFDHEQADAVLNTQILRMSRRQRERISDELACIRYELDELG